VINSHGQVQIEGGAGQDIILTLKKTIWDKNENQAGQLAAELKLQTKRDGSKLILSTNRDDFRRKIFQLISFLKYQPQLLSRFPTRLVRSG